MHKPPSLPTFAAQGGLAFVAYSVEDVERAIFGKKPVKMEEGKRYWLNAA
jgi:hypothetical protein